MLKRLQFDLEKEKCNKYFSLQHCKIHSYKNRTDKEQISWSSAGSSGVLARLSSIHLLCRQKSLFCFNMHLLLEGAGEEWHCCTLQTRARSQLLFSYTSKETCTASILNFQPKTSFWTEEQKIRLTYVFSKTNARSCLIYIHFFFCQQKAGFKKKPSKYRNNVLFNGIFPAMKETLQMNQKSFK